MLFNSKPKYLIAGLGNPGLQYEKTRHNAGFICADKLIDYYKASEIRVKANAFAYKAALPDREVYIIKPQTFMNLSGEAVRDVMHFFKIPINNIIIIYDDVSLDAGKIRIRPKGSDGGHNGIWDIIKNLNSEQFLRIKIGVGKKPHPEYDLKDWVLGKFSDEEYKRILEAADKTGAICDLLMAGELDKARNKYNG
ncbi:MAG: aminoacyl-tRNA hydrolase [Clostridia bacterium]|nr:aminoacyl-tRNA hydrolase [Clostridia bacterium]